MLFMRCCLSRMLSNLLTRSLACSPQFPFSTNPAQAFNYISNKGYNRMSREDEKHWCNLFCVIYRSVKTLLYSTGTLLMVLSRPVTDAQIVAAEKAEDKPVKKHTPSKVEGGAKVQR